MNHNYARLCVIITLITLNTSVNLIVPLIKFIYHIKTASFEIRLKLLLLQSFLLNLQQRNTHLVLFVCSICQILLWNSMARLIYIFLEMETH